MPELNRSIRHLTYPYSDSRGGGSTPSSSRMHGGVVRVLLRRRGVSACRLGTAAAGRPRSARQSGRPPAPAARCGCRGRSGPMRNRRATDRSTISRYAAWSVSRYAARPLLVLEVERESAAIELRQPIDFVRARPTRQVANESPAFDASARNELRIQPDDVRVVVDVAWRQVVRVALLEDAPQEVDRLVERVDRDLRVEFGPQRIEDLVPRG